jgi:hypothetical protein
VKWPRVAVGGALAVTLLSCWTTPALAAVPANDDFDNATAIPSLPFQDALNTVDGTVAVDDPARTCGGLDRTIWYTITPSKRMRIEVDTVDSMYDTTLSVYTGSRGALTEIACSEDQLYFGMAKLGFDAAAGTTYHIMMGGWVGGPGGDWVIDVTRGLLQSTLDLTRSRTRILYRHSVTVTAHLHDVADLTNKTVSIYKTPYGGIKTLVKMAAVDSMGNLSAIVPLTKNTDFVAEWAGEEGWMAAASPIRSVGVRVITTTRLSGFYGSSGAYKLYHAGNDPKVTGTVVPNHAGKPLNFIAQIHRAGAWRLYAAASFKIRATGSVSAFLINPSRGFAYRVKTSFLADADHYGNASAWKYFRVT